MWRNLLLPVWIIGTALSFTLPEHISWQWWLAAAVVCLIFGKYRRWFWLASAFCIGMAWGIFRTDTALQQQWRADQDVVPTVLTIIVNDLPVSDARRTRFTATAYDAEHRAYRLQLSDYAKRDWPVGSRWSVTARVRAPIGESNPHGFNREAWALANGIDGMGTMGKERRYLGKTRFSGSLLLPLRQKIDQNWQSVSEYPNGAALMRALSIGEQSALSNEVWATFRPLGLNHLVSISGLHISMVALLVAALVRRLLLFLPFSFQRPRTVIALAALSAAGVYAALAGFGIPVVRAFLMLAVLSFFWAKYGIQAAWKGWWWALFGVLLWDPFAVLAVGTWLSFGLTAALIWSGSWRVARQNHLFLRAQWTAMLTSFVAVGVLFFALPIWSPIVNLVAIPWFSWVLVPLALLASLFPLMPLQHIAAFLGEHTLGVLSFLGNHAPEYGIAAPPLPLLLLAVIALGIALLPRGFGLRPLAWLILLGLWFYRPPAIPSGSLNVTVWDVGQGLSVSLQTANHHLLFDTGTESAAAMQLLPNLRAIGIQQLDMLVLSHHDNDHDGGHTLITRALKPHNMMAGQPFFYLKTNDCHTENAWEWDGVHFEWLSIPPETRRADNDQSCILRAVVHGQAVLITGDLSQRGERALMERYGNALYSQILVLGHHGSQSSSSGSFLNTVSPQYAVSSSGYANAFHHPNHAVLARLNAHRIPLLRTDQQGAWNFILSPSGIQAAPLRTARFYWQRKPFDAPPP